MGLPESERIARILVHPKNGDVVYACVPGKLWSDSAGPRPLQDDRRRQDLVAGPQGREPVDRLLAASRWIRRTRTCCSPGMWDFRRKGWTFRSGGDGPDAPPAAAACSARPTAARPGRRSTPRPPRACPPAPWGRIEVAVAPSDPTDRLRVHRVDATRRSSAPTTAAQTWEQRDKSQMMVWRPFYFAHLVVDPDEPDRLFKPDVGLIVSEDGGKSFAEHRRRLARRLARPLDRSRRTPSTSSAATTAACGSRYDGGNRWWKANNLPISQFYHVSVDDKDPVPGLRRPAGQQLLGRRLGVSRAASPTRAGRTSTAATASGRSSTRPTRTAVYAESQGGYIGRVDRRTHAARDIQPKAGYKEKLRFNWNTPIARQPDAEGHDLHRRAVPVPLARPRRQLGAHLARSDDERSREAEAGAVGRRHRRQLGGRDAHDDLLDQRVAEGRRSVIWVGTDDGNLQLTRDGGKTLDERRRQRAGAAARRRG